VSVKFFACVCKVFNYFCLVIVCALISLSFVSDLKIKFGKYLTIGLNSYILVLTCCFLKIDFNSGCFIDIYGVFLNILEDILSFFY